jgi:Zn-dependent protease
MPIRDPPYVRERRAASYPTYNPEYEPPPRSSTRQRRFATSPTELFHLGVAVGVLTAALLLWMTNPLGNPTRFGQLTWGQRVPIALAIAVTGFATHEIAHKLTAQHYGHWSEFRYSLPGLALTLVMSATGFLFGAPGATWHTASGRRDNGKISMAGPLVNVIIALAAFPFVDPGSDDLVPLIASAVLLFNVILAIFNLIPIGPLDGKKVLKWSPPVYAVMVGLTILLLIYAEPFRFIEP